MNHRILIIEDEPISAARLARMITDILPDAEIETPLATVEDVVARLRQDVPYWLIFADIQIGGGNVFQAFGEATPQSLVIYTTAYDEYALNAIKSKGIDYLLKPIDKEELENAINKAAELATQNDCEAAARQGEAECGWRKRLLVSIGDGLMPISVEDINFIVLRGKKTAIHCKDGKEYDLPLAMNEIEAQLDPSMFFRLNRQYIVNIRAIRRIKNHFSSRLIVKIDGCDDDTIMVSKQKATLLKQWIDK